jgi:hypothetical protein
MKIHQSTYFWGSISTNESENVSASMILDVFRYLIWQSKLEKKVVAASVFFSNMQYLLTIICCSSRKISSLFDETILLDVSGNGGQRGADRP